MRRTLDVLARLCRPTLLVGGVLLTAGLLLTGLNMLVIGWSAYTVGYVGAIIAFLGIGAANRDRMDGWSWAGLILLEIGLVVGLAAVASIWSTYAQNGLAAGPMLLPVDAAPLGYTGELLTWIGLAFFALAARGAGALSGATAWVLVAASVIGILAAFRVIAPLWWVLAVLIVALSLQWLGAAMGERARLDQAEAKTA